MKILALDLGVRCGFAIGDAGTIPRSGAVRLKRQSDPIEVAPDNLGCFLRDIFTLDLPDIVVIEHFLSPAAQKNANAAIGTLMLHGAVRGICGPYGLRVETPYDSTIRKHVCGKGRAGSREATKSMVLSRIRALQYIERGCNDEDRADAIAAWLYAECYYARCPPKELVLFREGVRP